jgi:two-component system, NarL family, nitrate/nitrite response regulator NarL
MTDGLRGGGDLAPPDGPESGTSPRRQERPLLSLREREILELTANGRRAADIGRDLHLGQSTVKTHLRNVYRKLGVSDRAAAVAEGIRRGFID